ARLYGRIIPWGHIPRFLRRGHSAEIGASRATGKRAKRLESGREDFVEEGVATAGSPGKIFSHSLGALSGNANAPSCHIAPPVNFSPGGTSSARKRGTATSTQEFARLLINAHTCSRIVLVA